MLRFGRGDASCARPEARFPPDCGRQGRAYRFQAIRATQCRDESKPLISKNAGIPCDNHASAWSDLSELRGDVESAGGIRHD